MSERGTLEWALCLLCEEYNIDHKDHERLGSELRELRGIEEAARIFLDEWDAGGGRDADTCDAAIALREALAARGAA